MSKCTLPSSFHYYNKTDESVGDYRFTEYKLCLTNKTNKNTKFTISKVNCAVLDAAIVSKCVPGHELVTSQGSTDSSDL